MQLDKYETTASKSLMRFEFYSVGPKGRIKKKIEFNQFLPESNVYNICFGDVDASDEIDDLAVTDNNDSQKVLATVASAAIKFLEKYPDKYVYASGSTKARSRLYKIGISKNFNEIQRTFNLYGYDDEWEPFEKGKNYEEFLIQLKK
jgi:hypothetical protein